jgi:two-component system, NarL family, response regulator LiaR
VVLLDLQLPRLDGVETIRALRGQLPVPNVLVLTALYDGRLIPEAIAAGAWGYVRKQGEIEERLTAMGAAQQSQQTTL